MKEFLEAGKKQKLNTGGYGTGSAQHFFMLDLARMAGMEVKWLAYNSGKDALVATMGKNLDGTLSNYSVITQGGERIRTIGVSTAQRIQDKYNIPTFKEQGFTCKNPLASPLCQRGHPQADPGQTSRRLEKGYGKARMEGIHADGPDAGRLYDHGGIPKNV